MLMDILNVDLEHLLENFHCHLRELGQESFVRKNIDCYTAFLCFNEDTRFAFYTTNSVESFNSVLEHIRQQKGGFFQSEDILFINIYIRYLNMLPKWKNGYPKIIAKLYYLRQSFVNLYGELPYEN